MPRQQPSRQTDEDGRWRLLKRCLTDSTIGPGHPFADALILLFAAFTRPTTSGT
ncbi:hypothetical protein ACWDG1_41340 [Streptomyces sp. NPDC001177]